MKVHEYQAKELMKQFGIATLKGAVVNKLGEVEGAVSELGGNSWVVKAQVHAGGRGKGGGIRVSKNLEEVRKNAEALLGNILVTPQTGSQGKKVHTLLIEECCEIDHEYYVAIVLDRSKAKITLIASSEGGMDIEEVAKKFPEKIIKVSIDAASGFSPFASRKIAHGIGLKGDQLKSASKIFKSLYELYVSCDCTIAEINPLVTTKDGRVVALDAKLNFDDNSLFRHKELVAMSDPNEESNLEKEATLHGFSYVSLDGDIGCMVNGAGLAMSTMDIIKLYGGDPANFLDVGGGAPKETVEKAFSFILSDENVKAILVNIFGGIMKCDVIAEGIVSAAKKIGIKVPLVVRLEGTNVAKGRNILEQSDISVITADTLDEAAKKACQAAKGEEI